MADAEVEMTRLARRLREAGRGDLTRRLNRAVNEAVKPLKRELPGSARRILPRRGGLGERVATTKISVRKQRWGVSIVAKNKYNLAKLDEGQVRHPDIRTAHRPRSEWVWVQQRVRPGWFSEPAERLKPAVTRQVQKALDDMIREIEG